MTLRGGRCFCGLCRLGGHLLGCFAFLVARMIATCRIVLVSSPRAPGRTPHDYSATRARFSRDSRGFPKQPESPVNLAFCCQTRLFPLSLIPRGGTSRTRRQLESLRTARRTSGAPHAKKSIATDHRLTRPPILGPCYVSRPKSLLQRIPLSGFGKAVTSTDCRLCVCVCELPPGPHTALQS